jgi:tryptophanyl-tRNA synthetase
VQESLKTDKIEAYFLEGMNRFLVFFISLLHFKMNEQVKKYEKNLEKESEFTMRHKDNEIATLKGVLDEIQKNYTSMRLNMNQRENVFKDERI